MKETNLDNDNKTSRIMSIDYLKAIAVVLVILTHLLTIDQRLSIGGPYWITMAVPIFMIISGFTYYMSAEKSNIRNLREYFDRKILIPKLSRILVPYMFIIVIEILLVIIIPVKFPNIGISIKPTQNYLILFLRGGRGAGSYYIPMMLQLIFLFPFMLILFKKSPYKSVSLFFIIHLSFDIISNFLPIPKGAYRLLIFRYLVFIVMGMILYYNHSKIKRKKLIIFFSSISVTYIYITNYYVYIPKAFTKWTRTSLPTVFWAFLLVYLGMKYLEIENKNILTNMASTIGKASYHIFLVQKLFFRFGINKVYKDINIVIKSLLAIILCCSIGIAFYYFERLLRKIIRGGIA